MAIVGYITRYYERKNGILSMHEYRTKALTPMHEEIRKRTGGETLSVDYDAGLAKNTGGMLGEIWEHLPGCGPDARHEEARKVATKEYYERRAAKRKAKAAAV